VRETRAALVRWSRGNGFDADVLVICVIEHAIEAKVVVWPVSGVDRA
jgi:hypothetical protein